MKNRRGFTLIELLVVIAIIAILAAILFPVFIKAQQKSWQTKCCNNAMQVGKAFRMYSDDWSGFLPNIGEGAAPGAVKPGWCLMAYALKRYISGDAAKQFVCPADTGDKCIGGSNAPYATLVWRSSWAWPNGWGPGWVEGCKMENCRINVNGLRPNVWQFQVPPSKRPIVFDHRPWHWSTTGTGWTNIAGKNGVLWADGHASMSAHNLMIAFMSNVAAPPGFP